MANTKQYAAPGTVSLLPLITKHQGTVLGVESDGEFVYASVEFPYLADRQLCAFELREDYTDVDYQVDHSNVMGLAFPITDYYL